MPAERRRVGNAADAHNRRIIAARYLEIAELATTEEGPGANNVIVGIAVLAGIAASDTICLSATGSRYAGEDHAEAARVLARTDKKLGAELGKLIRLKPGAHYGSTFISDSDRRRALRAAATLVQNATDRTLRAP
ncbi:hypothetical protein [Mobilicoccus caccae]|uniref:Uncharacterized protein n=1 Tax=Mobilicoccus caccae TaxID=1859295 RepID=A0ABQ6IV98_9MICO|nr:hypothetical protein [Mobilicoccus caccae]GMA41874.1 hypothetical protein GCM10025883_39190 [Mobilicoccus caccae]